MKILLTGATGFIGSNLINYIQENNDKNEWFLLTSRKIKGFKCILHNNYTFSRKDFLKAGAERLDVVIMLGGHVEKPGDDKNHVVREHLQSVVNSRFLLDNLPCIPKKIIFCSSTAVYGFDSAKAWNEDMPIIEYSEKSDTDKNLSRTYALVKVLQERLVGEWCKEKGCVCQILRIGPVYGPKRCFQDFLGTCLRCVRNKIIMDMYAPLHQMWNYVYSKDVSKWLCMSCDDLEEERTINLVSDGNYTTKQILDTVKQVWPEFEYIIDETRGFKGQNKAFDSSLRRSILGNEEYDLFKGLSEIRQKEF